MKAITLFAILVLLQSNSSFAGESNAFFMGGSLSAAKERANRENKLLILEFTAKWCLPCQYMEKNVFRNQDVQKFSEQHAIIFKVDIDEDKNLKAEFNIEALPTIIIMKASGQVLSRKEESLNAENFMRWIEKSKNEDPESSLSKVQPEINPVQIELPNLDSQEMENALAQKETKATGKISAQAESNYHLQTGVFASKSNAESMAALLNTNFQQSIKIVEESNGSNSIFRVCVGSFQSKEEAEVFKQLLEQYKVKGVIRNN